MSTQITLVGLDPGGHLGTEPLDPGFPSGRRIASLCRLSPQDYCQQFHRVNLLQAPSRSVQEYLDGVVRLLPDLRGKRVVALGGKVSQYLGLPDRWWEWRVGQGFVGAASPHPSGRNRWWNDPKNVETAGKFFQSVQRACIHVEGCDGSGKSTFVTSLSSILGYPVIPTDDPPKSSGECLRRIAARLAPGIVCDRSSGLISEMVYGPVLRHGTFLTTEEMEEILLSMIGSVTFIYCRPDTLRPTVRPGEDSNHVKSVFDKLKKLQSQYDSVMGWIEDSGGRVVRYNWMEQTPEEIAKCVGS